MSDIDPISPVTDAALIDNADTPSESPSEALPGPAAPEAPPVVAFTLTEAAERCRVHRATIRRKLDDGAFPNAWREDDGAGPWRIPLGDLLAAGFNLSALGSGPPDSDSDRTDERDSDDQAELARLRVELQHEREMRQAHERTIELLGQAIRALSPGPVQQQSQPPPEPVASPRRRWWKR